MTVKKNPMKVPLWQTNTNKLKLGETLKLKSEAGKTCDC